MKLYSVDRSPFGSRVRALAAFKGLDLPSAPPVGGDVKSPEFLALNPMGKVPVLELDDGATLAESEVIVEYLEHTQPGPSALPLDPIARARARLVARVAEVYVMAPLFGLFAQLNPATRDPAAIDRAFADIESGLGLLEHHLTGGDFAYGDSFTVADCMVTPTLFWVDMIHKMFGRPDPTGNFPKIVRYLSAARRHPILGRIWTSMDEDLAKLRAARAAG